MSQKIDRTGECKSNKQGVTLRIVEYKNNKNVIVEFPWGEQRKTTYQRFRDGIVTARAVDLAKWRADESEQPSVAQMTQEPQEPSSVVDFSDYDAEPRLDGSALVSAFGIITFTGLLVLAIFAIIHIFA